MLTQPQYLIVHFVRFFWKKASAVAGTEATKTKIMRNVSFPKVFDVYEFCSDELKKSLDHGREYEKKIRDEETEMMIDSGNKEEKKEESKDKGVKISDEALYRDHGNLSSNFRIRT
jgi:ubiquitin carboxyl-terminal hydrolase 14